MIVKLTYSAELEEVPSEVGKIVDTTASEMETVTCELEAVANDLTKKEPDVKSAVSKIEFAMKFVEKLDTKLKDCQSILSGYLGVLEQQAQKQTPPVQEVKTEQTEAPSETQTKGASKKKAG